MGGYKSSSRSYDYNLDVRARVHFPQDFTYSAKNKLPLTQDTTSYRSSSRSGVEDPVKLLSDYQKGFVKNNNFNYNPADTGHPFQTRKFRMDLSHGFVNYTTKVEPDLSFIEWHGPLHFTNTGVDAESVYAINRNDYIADHVANSIGTRFVNETIPTKSVASLGEAVAELKDGLPDLPGLILRKGKLTPAAFGSEFLNAEFGLRPMIQDILKCANAVLNSKQIVAQYVRDSGRNVSRKRSESPNVQVSKTSIYPPSADPLSLAPVALQSAPSSWLQYFVPQANYQGGHWGYTRVDREIKTTTSLKFSASYSYFLPDGDSLLAKFEAYEQLANKLLGTRLTFDTLWELAPWSWLSDWFFDIGNIISNVSAFSSDSLVMRYGYLMQETEQVITYTGYGFTFERGQKLEPHVSKFTTLSKQRFRANPYGFGLTDENLSAEQWTILGALGMTKGPKKLRYWD